MIKIHNVTFGYKNKKIFENLNFSVSEGARIMLSGASGIGKTTLLRLVLRLEEPQSGSVDIGGAVVSAVFQEDRLLPFKTVLQNLTLFAPQADALECLEALGLKDAANLYPAELSGGMARRVAIARALARSADIYIFDEPFSGLDRENILACAEFINKKTAQKTVIVVSHIAEDAKLLNAEIIDIEAL